MARIALAQAIRLRDLAAQFRDAAKRRGTNVSALIASLITEYLQFA